MAQATVPVLDRGFIFGDGVYEVVPLYHGKYFRLEQHLARLQRSLDGIRLINPHSVAEWRGVLEELVARNPAAPQQTVYMQITRGVAPRDLAFPNVPPTVFAMLNQIQAPTRAAQQRGISAITVEDLRWQHCDIKAITLLPNVLARQQALDAGVQEAILVRNGEALEGAASNLFMVRGDALITPPQGRNLLPGITRDVVLTLASEAGMRAREGALTIAGLRAADELWLTSSNKEIQAVTRLNGGPVGSGVPGPWWEILSARYDLFKATLVGI